MARQQTKVQTASFVGGFITEASPLTFPENSCLDVKNVDFNVDGSASRRRGMKLEDGYATHAYTAGATDVYSCTSWRNAAGRSDKNFIVVKAGRYLFFYEDTLPLSANKHAFQVDLNTYKVSSASTADVINSRVDMAHGKGFMFVTSKNIEPLRISYDPSGDTFSVEELSLFERDFSGVDDNLEVSTRPLTISSEHLYNLLNQGWTQTLITQYFDAIKVYPSNADIWGAGRDANNNFSPGEMNKINFGNSPAPKGRFIRNIFNTTQSFNLDSKISISSWSVSCPSTVTITTSANHGLSVGNSVTVEGTSYNWEVIPGDTDGSADVNGTFTVATVVNATTFTYTTTITQCSNITNKNNSGTVTVGTITNPSGTVEDWRPNAVAFFAGRAFYSGIESSRIGDNIYFSQILIDEDKAGKCYQDADPTSDEISDLIDTDGGSITVAGLGKVAKMVPVQSSLLVFSSNGIWEISGDGEGFFRATSYSVRKVGNISCRSPDAIVQAEGLIILFSDDGIYSIQENEISGLLSHNSLTDQTIRSYYLGIPSISKERTLGAYDDQLKKVVWAFRRVVGGVPAASTEALILDLRTQSFTKYEFKINDHYPAALAVIKDFSLDTTKIRVLTVIGGTSLSFSDIADNSFEDWGETDSEAYIITGYATMGDIGIKKQARQLILHMDRTETGFETVGDSLQSLNPSGCKVRIAWDFTNDAASNKWGSEFQGYRYRQLYIPSGPSDTYNTGYEVITTKTKLRGTGRAFSLQFRSEPGKDMRILGWSISGDAETHE